HLGVGRNVGAPKPVDRLFRITHDEKRPRPGPHLPPVGFWTRLGRQADDDFGLDGIRILELIDEEMIKPSMKVVANRSVSSQEISRQQKQVFIIELTGGYPLPPKLVNCRLDQGKQDRVEEFTPPPKCRHDDVVPQIGESLSEPLQVPSVG